MWDQAIFRENPPPLDLLHGVYRKGCVLIWLLVSLKFSCFWIFLFFFEEITTAKLVERRGWEGGLSQKRGDSGCTAMTGIAEDVRCERNVLTKIIYQLKLPRGPYCKGPANPPPLLLSEYMLHWVHQQTLCDPVSQFPTLQRGAPSRGQPDSNL